MPTTALILVIAGIAVLVWLAVSRNRKISGNNRHNSKTKDSWYE